MDLTELTSVGGQSIVDRPSKTVDFIGLGLMGGGMAKILLLAGVDLIVCDLRQEFSNEYV